jgi:hypothetical protein
MTQYGSGTMLPVPTPTVLAALVAQLRRLTNEPTQTPYTDAELELVILSYPSLDERGISPYSLDTSTSPPTQIATIGWLPTYDIHAAAADIWEEKMATAGQDFDFDADGGSYRRSQVAEFYLKQVRYHRSRRRIGTVKSVAYPTSLSTIPLAWVGNAPEED